MEYTAKQGTNTFLAFRLLSTAAEQTGIKLALQTTHNFTRSRDSDSTATKDGNVNSTSPLTVEASVENILSDDPLNDLLIEAIEKDEIVEIWEIDRSSKTTEGKYKAWYFQVNVTNIEEDHDADGNSTNKADFSVIGSGARGELTLTADQEEEVSYAFRDLSVYTEVPTA
ncbi:MULTISPECIES: phage major tail protein, TP901-1 family [Listeria]|uniref:phage major tail protein, TP901-1 family n=1 Tax=Listeria TaxID=1637 RepID=UPI000B58E37D|nr:MULTISPECIES: phage major tail protein, TP901-1 family [Listeria]